MSAAPARRPSKASSSSMSAAPRTAPSRCSATMCSRASRRWSAAPMPTGSTRAARARRPMATGICARASSTTSLPLLQAGVPLYEAYAGVLQSFNQLGTLQQRLGNRSWTVVAARRRRDLRGGERLAPASASGARSRAARRVPARDQHHRHRLRRFDLAADRRASTPCSPRAASGQLIGGVAVHFGTASSDVSSIFGNGSDRCDRLRRVRQPDLVRQHRLLCGRAGAGDRLRQRPRSPTRPASASSRAMTASAMRSASSSASAFRSRPNWALTPQAQLDLVVGRLRRFRRRLRGRSVARQRRQPDRPARPGGRPPDGMAGRRRQRAAAPMSTASATSITISRTARASTSPVRLSTARSRRCGAGSALGGTYAWADDKYALYGEALAKTSLEDFGDSYAISGTVGFKTTW